MDEDNLTLEEQRLLKIVNMGISQVVIPALDDMEKEIRGDIKKLDQRVSNVENRLDQIDRKLDRVTATSFDNQYRLNNLEALPTIAHELKLKK